MPPHHSIDFAHSDGDQATAARAAFAMPGGWVKHGAVSGTNEVLPAFVKKTIGLEIELHRDMGTAVEVGPGLALVSDGEGPAGLPGVNDIKGHAQAAIDQIAALAQKDGWFIHDRATTVATQTPSGR